MGEQVEQNGGAERVRVYRVIGIFDSPDTCEFCGRTNLARTVGFEDIETGAEIYAGTSCAETVKLLTVTADDLEPKARSPRQLLTVAERLERTRKIEASADALRWRLVELLEAARYSAEGRTELVRLGCDDFPVPSEGREYGVSYRFGFKLCRYFFAVGRALEAKQLAKQEANLGDLAARIETARKEWAGARSLFYY